MYHQTPMEPLGFAGSAPMSSPFVSSAPGLAHPIAPALPPRPCNTNTNNYGLGNSMGGTYGGYGSSFGGLGGAFGGLGGYTGMGGYGAGYGGGYGGFGSPYGGGYNRFGMNPYENMESRFIQMAEESSRPAFQSIESVVNAIGSVAMMLENTFIALTSSFRAILGVAENFGRLRSLFAQFWSTFAVFRSINWLIRKLLVMLGIRTEDEFKAWAEAALQMQSMSGDLQDTRQPESRASTWPILLFFGIVFSAPYIILKMLNGINNSIQEKLNDPSSWKNPMKALAQFDFHANSPEEISFRANQIVTIAPQAVQGNLWNSGWLMASTDGKQAGLIPVNYVKVYRNTGTTNDQQSDAIQPIPPLPAIQMNIPNSNNNAPILKPQPLAPISEECPADTSVVTNLIRNGSTTNIDLEKAFDESCA